MRYDFSQYISWDFCDEMVNNILSSMNGLKNVCFLMCGLFALLYFANILMKTWAKGEAFDFHSLFRPFIIGIVILNFNIVYEGIDAIAKPITTYVESISEVQETITKKEKQYEEAEKKYNQKVDEIVTKQDLGFFDKAEQFVDNFSFYALDVLMDGIEIILCIIYSALKITLRAFNITFRVILIVFGPIAFSLSIIPYFKDNWKSWIAKYINISLYLPVAATIDVILYEFRKILLDLEISKFNEAVKEIENSNSIFGVDAPFQASLITCLFMIIFIALYLIIPSIVNLIIDKGDNSAMNTGLAASTIGVGKVGHAIINKGTSLAGVAGNAGGEVGGYIKDTIKKWTDKQESKKQKNENNNNGSGIIN